MGMAAVHRGFVGCGVGNDKNSLYRIRAWEATSPSVSFDCSNVRVHNFNELVLPWLNPSQAPNPPEVKGKKEELTKSVR